MRHILPVHKAQERSLTPGEMKGMQQSQAQAQENLPTQDSSASAMAKKAQAMQRLG